MDDTPASENSTPSEPNLNKLDLSQLQGFSFGTQWSQEKQGAREDRRGGDDRPRREGGAPDRRDRRVFRRPAGEAPNAPQGSEAPRERDASQPAGDRRPDFRGRRDRGEFRGGPRRDDAGAGAEQRGGPRGEGRGPRQFSGDRAHQQDRLPYESPFFAVTFYPEDTSFATLAKTIRSSCRTIELFEIARTVIGKADRFVIVLQRKPSAPQAASESGVPGVKAAPLYLSVPDGVPFESEDAAISHVLQKHIGLFFDAAEVEIEPPKGNFQIINRCSITGELLGPPNYHRYNQIVAQHHASRINRMSLEAYRSKIESVRDAELVNQWLEKMKKVTRYTWKQEPAPAPVEGVEAVAPVVYTFDSIEDARVHLLTHARDKVVRTTENVRFHGRMVETLPQGEIRRAIEGTLERQRRFPLDTANALRGRLRREGFTIFKKGSKGISYVCAVKRKFRVPGQTFAESINNLIAFVEAHPMVKASELPEKFLGIVLPKPVEKKPEADAAAVATEAAPVELSVEHREKLSRLQGDLVWLVREGYVTEFIDSRLFAPPPMVEARKKEVESEDHDPENFPEVPVEAPKTEISEAPAGEAQPEAPSA